MAKPAVKRMAKPVVKREAKLQRVQAMIPDQRLRIIPGAANRCSMC